MICKECGKEMLLTDVDYTYYWNIFYKYECKSCNVSCIVNKSIDVNGKCNISEKWSNEKKVDM